MSQLIKLGIVKDKKGATLKIFNRLFPNFLEINYLTPSEYINTCWSEFKKENNKDKATNGKMFEYIIASLFVRENLLPFFVAPQITFVPNVIFDFMFYSEEYGPICISLKKSLRERYKQADLEAMALKQVHRRAQTYLLTLDKGDAENANKKIKDGEISALTEVITATENSFDTLILYLKSLTLIIPREVPIIKAQQIITLENAGKVR